MDELEKYALDNNIPIMMKDGIEFLLEFIAKNNIKNILEIGSAIGYSAIRMALVDKNIKVTTIERDVNRYNEAVNNIKKFNLESQITIINDDAFNVNLNSEYDLIFIDAAKSQYIKFFEKFKVNLKYNGFIVSDNLNFHGLTKCDEKSLSKNVRGLVRKLNNYTEFLKNNNEFSTEFYNIGDGVSISKRKEVIMKEKGFTLVELLGVIVILAAIALIAFPPLLNQINKSQNKINDATKQLVLSSANSYVYENGNDFPQIDGNVYCIPFMDLINSGLLKEGIVDANDKLSQSKSVKVTYSSDYSYEIVDSGDCVPIINNRPCTVISGTGRVVGDEIACGTEHFYVMSNDGNNITMLAKYNLKVGRIYTSSSAYNEIPTTEEGYGLQDSEMKGYVDSGYPYKGILSFSSTDYWSSITSSYPAFVYNSNSNLYQYVENYESYLKSLGVSSVSASLMSHEQATALGCNNSCITAPSWVYSTSYWLGSAYDIGDVWYVASDGMFDGGYFSSDFGVRPVVTISTDEIKTLYTNGILTSTNNCINGGICSSGTSINVKVNSSENYNFYVISDDGEELTLLMDQNLGGTVAWGVASSTGPLTALEALKERTDSWTNIESYSYTLTDDGGGPKYEPIEVTDVRSRLLTRTEAKSLGCSTSSGSCPEYLYKNLYSANTEDEPGGYWLSGAFFNIDNLVHRMQYTGYATESYSTCAIANTTGIRPVIKVTK